MWYSDLSSQLVTVSVEFLTLLVRFSTAAYSDSVSEPAFFEPDPIFATKYRNGSRNEGFPSVSVYFHRYLRRRLLLLR